MRHWHWLHNVMAVAKVSHASALDSEAPRHRLCRELSCKRRFESIALDGYDPGAMNATDKQSLFDFVATKRGYAHATAGYRHGFWRYLVERNPERVPPTSWIGAQFQLTKHGLLRMEDIDEGNAEALGLRYDRRDFDNDDETDGSHLLVTTADAFANLDGMLALLILYREALDKADGAADNLRIALVKSTQKFAGTFAFEDEQLHTWEFLVQTRILKWDPSFKPSLEDLSCAKSELLAKRSGRRKHAGKLDSGSPEMRTKGRAERRWRRQVMMYGCNLSLQRCTGRSLIIREESKLNNWLVQNRTLISAHVEHALDRCMGGESRGNAEAELPPLIMPAAIYRQRRRPINDEQAWHVYGDDVPYDFIPVSVASSSKSR
jgi:hypothetical protein